MPDLLHVLADRGSHRDAVEHALRFQPRERARALRLSTQNFNLRLMQSTDRTVQGWRLWRQNARSPATALRCVTIATNVAHGGSNTSAPLGAREAVRFRRLGFKRF